MVWDIVKVGLEDVQKAFDISENLYEKYVEGEIQKNEDLVKLINFRDGGVDWQKETPLGGMGTTLNACVLYSLVRHFDMKSIIETGVSGGYYTSFILAAKNKNGNSILTSLELSDDTKEVGKLIPESFKIDWELITGNSSLAYFEDLKISKLDHAEQLYCHDSLHTIFHMLKELNEFKKSLSKEYFVFIDDEKSDNFWSKCLQTNAFKRSGYNVKWISGAESRLNGHLGGFIYFNKL